MSNNQFKKSHNNVIGKGFGYGALAIIALFSLLPLLMAGIESTVDWNGMRRTGGHSFAAYDIVFSSARLQSLGTIAMRSMIVSTVAVLFAIPTAAVINGTRFRNISQLFGLLLITPFFVSATLRTFGWRLLLQENGYLNALFNGMFGWRIVAREILFSELAVSIALLAATLPISVICIVAALPKPESTLWRVADECGAAGLSRWLWMIIPLGMPGILAAWLAVFCLVFGSSVEPTILGAPEDCLHKMISDLQSANAFSSDDALACIIIMGILLTTLVAAFTAGIIVKQCRMLVLSVATLMTPFSKSIRSISGRFREAAGWGWCASILLLVLTPVFCVIIRSFTPDLPVGNNDLVSSKWELTAYANIFSGNRLDEAWTNSVIWVGLPVAIITMLLTFLLSTVYWWFSRWRNVVFLGLFTVACFPPDVYALAIGQCSSYTDTYNWPTPLIFAHVALALPFCAAIGVCTASQIKTGVLAVGLELSGGKKFRVLFEIVLPLMLSSLMTAFAIGLLFSVNDYIRSFYLSGPRQSLSRYIYGKMASGADATVYAIGTLNIIAAILVMGMCWLCLHVAHRLGEKA